jgi:hypothetical protein
MGGAMKFDLDQAIAGAAAFAEPRWGGTDGESRAAERAAKALARLDLRVERTTVYGSRVPALAEAWLGWLGVALWAAALELATHAGAGWLTRLALALGAVIWLRLTTVEGFGFLGAWTRNVPSTNVVAWREVEPPAPVRVVFLTALETHDPRRAAMPLWLSTPMIGLLLGGQVFCSLTINRNPLHLPGWLGPLFLGLVELAIAGRILHLARRPATPDAGDNRTGLAVLIELARGWSDRTHARIETRFVATGGQSLGRAGLRSLARTMAELWPAKPTIVIEWLAPGIGPGLTLIDLGTGGLATSAAADLWIPHRVIGGIRAHRARCPFGCNGPGYVGLTGTGVGVTQAINRVALNLTAQLATEIALRWERKHKRPPEAATTPAETAPGAPGEAGPPGVAAPP